MITLRRILHPTDFSQNARTAQAYACQLAEQNAAELHLLHVLPDPGYMLAQPEIGIGVPYAYWEDLRPAIERKLAEVLEPERKTKLKVVTALRKGSPFSEIIRYAQEQSVDLIVMGTHGRTGLSHLIIGSVAENVVRKAKCPVLTVHPADHQFVMP